MKVPTYVPMPGPMEAHPDFSSGVQPDMPPGGVMSGGGPAYQP